MIPKGRNAFKNRETFNRGLGVHPDTGEAIVTIGDRWCYVECDRTPFVVVKLSYNAGPPVLHLNTEEEVSLRSDGFFLHEDHVAVRLDDKRWARIWRSTYADLAPHLIETNEGYAFELPSGTYVVGAPPAFVTG